MAHNILQFGKDLEVQIQKELRVLSPIFWCEDVKDFNQPTNSLRSDILATIWGDELGLRGQLLYNLPGPSYAQLRAGIIQPGMNSCVAILHYSANLDKSIRGKITFAKNSSGEGAFCGDTPLCDRMNSNSEILTIASALYRGEYTSGDLFVQIIPQFVLEGNGNVLHLDVLTVPLSTKGFFSGKIIYSVNEFLRLITLLKTLL